MMRDLRQYWQEVRALEGNLPQFVWLVSLQDAKRGMVGGRMAEVGAPSAAQLLHTKSHRLATDDEIAAHLEKEDRARKQVVHEVLRRKGIAVVAVPIDSPVEGGKPAATRRR